MESCFEARRAGTLEDTVLLLEHEPVITLGRGARRENILVSEASLEEAGIVVFETGRGGDVTLHAPGQLVAYPIFDLSPDRRDVRKYVQGLTRVMNRLISPFGLEGGTMDGKIGLWIDSESPDSWPGQEQTRIPVKIGAIGVRISRWITQHGFALNLSTDLSLFRAIVPCGIREYGVTSVLALTEKEPNLSVLAAEALKAFEQEYSSSPAKFTDLSHLSQEDLFARILRQAQPT